MFRYSGLLKTAAKTTVKGAAITLTSTVFSCVLACYIEIGAHRLVYRYFPHRYANVQQANGLTQAQLDAVRIYNVETILSPAETISSKQQQTTTGTTTTTTLFSSSKPEETPADNLFWKEEHQTQEQDFNAQSQDILGCAMTG
jgi:hypothetical protein